MATKEAQAALEGDWKNFTFRMLTASDVPAVEEFMKRFFFTSEPVSVIAGVTEANCLQLDLDQLYQELISHNLSFAAFDKENGNMAAIRTICRHKRGQDDSKAMLNSSEAIKIILKFIHGTAVGSDICAMYDVEEYAHLRFVCVDHRYRNLGLAKELYKRAIEICKASGFIAAGSVFASPYSRAAARKFGFVELQRRYFRTMTDLKGKFVKREATDEEFASVMATRL